MWWMLIIPIMVIISLYYVCPHRMAWWEYMIPIAVSLLSIVIVDAICDYAMSSDEEFHGGWVIKAVWDEHWTETYTETETYTDSDGKVQTRVVTKTRFHPDEYKIIDSNSYQVSINESYFEQLAAKFHNRHTEHPWRSGQSSWGDGRRFITAWDNNEQTFTPCFTSHRYENRVARSHSVFNFKDISDKEKKEYNLYEYPEIYDFCSQDSILGWNDSAAEYTLTRANAKLGAIKQVRIFILVFPNEPLQAGLYQQQYWKNGNKNEIVVCIGTIGDKINWVFPFAWDNENLLVNLREDISEQGTLNMQKVVDTTIKLAEKQFSRKKFKDFEYIKLEPPAWAVFLGLLFVLLVNFGVVYFVINNDCQ